MSIIHEALDVIARDVADEVSAGVSGLAMDSLVI